MPYDLGRPNSRWLPYQVYRDEIIAKTVRRPYLIAGKRRGPSRWRYKRGGRWKNKARRNCLRGGNPEKKFLDLVVASAPAETGTITTLGIIPQGDGESERIGRKATITNIIAHGRVLIAGTTASASIANRVRVMVVWDRSTNGAAFTPADLMNTAGTADIDSFRDLSHVGRFTVLYNKVYTLNPALSGNGTNDQSGDLFRDGKFNLTCCIPIEYDASATTGAITTQQVNSIHILTFEERSSPATSVNLVVRVRYVG